MKRSVFFLLIALLALAVSCKKEDKPQWSLPGYEINFESITAQKLSLADLKATAVVPEDAVSGVVFGFKFSKTRDFLEEKTLVKKFSNLSPGVNELMWTAYDISGYDPYYCYAFYSLDGNEHCTDVVEYYPGAVDLGLSVDWAVTNCGGTAPSSEGSSYAWGAIVANQTPYTMSGYTYTTDSATLPLKDDAANYWWGKGWRYPTKAEMEELLENCTKEWTTVSSYKGLKLNSKKKPGASIFLPMAGGYSGSDYIERNQTGYYWTSTRIETSEDTKAYILHFYDETAEISDNYFGYFGFAIRPVRKR